jgi:phosphoglycerate dehydrogenase-like enzyme
MKLLLMYSTHAPSQEHAERLRSMGCEVRVAGSEEEAIRESSTAEVFFGHRYLRQCLPGAAKLRWVHSTAGGVNHLPIHQLAERRILLSRSICMAGVVARHAHTMAWSLTRGLPQFTIAQSERRWAPAHDWLPLPRKAMVIGLGPIGREIVRLAERDDVAVTCVNRSVKNWHGLLPEMDWIFVAIPACAGTEKLVDRAFLSALKTSAVFVLVGRPETVDLDALCEALRAGNLGGAALDVVPEDWKAPNHPIWATPGLFITPHVAAHAAERPAWIEREAEDQMRCYLANGLPNHLACASL